MVRLYVPAAVAVVLIAVFTALEAKFSDRFNTSAVTAEEFEAKFKGLPKEIGPWVGTDRPVDDKTLQVAGAVNYVSRTYRNSQTGSVVDLWLIVGHSRDIVRHTPDICYPAHGMGQDDPKPMKHPIESPGDEPTATFYTARFRTEVDITGMAGPKNQRVFWAWNANTPDEYQWDAPDSPRLHYGNNPKLYKMYFSAMMKDHDESIADNAALAFAKVMLPHVNRTLFPDHYKAEPQEEPASEAATTPADVPAAAQSTGETPASDTAPAAAPANPAASPTTAIPAGSTPATPPAEATNPAAAAQ